MAHNGQALNIDNGLLHLGTRFSYNGRFAKNNLRLAEQARKAMFSVLRKSRKLQLPKDLQLQLFDCFVVPMLFYGSEVTELENSEMLEGLCTQFYRTVLNVIKTTFNVSL